MNVLIFFLGLGIGLLSAIPNHPERPKPVVLSRNKGRPAKPAVLRTAVPLYNRR